MQAVQNAIIIALVFPACSVAGEIYGTISEGGKPVQNESVTVKCGQEAAEPSKPTDTYGSYRVVVRTQGRCTLSVRGLEAKVRSYDSAVRYDFEIRTEGANTLLKRK